MQIATTQASPHHLAHYEAKKAEAQALANKFGAPVYLYQVGADEFVCRQTEASPKEKGVYITTCKPESDFHILPVPGRDDQVVIEAVSSIAKKAMAQIAGAWSVAVAADGKEEFIEWAASQALTWSE